jgi:hypothetical protein
MPEKANETPLDGVEMALFFIAMSYVEALSEIFAVTTRIPSSL